ncbi:MAG: DUF3382 domain-containing protein, partial [Alphaproteobacteria bacterium]
MSAPARAALPLASALREAGLAAFVMAVLAFPLIGFVLADVSGGVTLRTRFEWGGRAGARVVAGGGAPPAGAGGGGRARAPAQAAARRARA